MNHILKTIQPYFNRVWSGQKTFEVRNNDRDFEVGDTIELKEYDPSTDSYSGRFMVGGITYVLRDYDAIKEGYVVFSFYIEKFIG